MIGTEHVKKQQQQNGRIRGTRLVCLPKGLCCIWTENGVQQPLWMGAAVVCTRVQVSVCNRMTTKTIMKDTRSDACPVWPYHVDLNVKLPCFFLYYRFRKVIIYHFKDIAWKTLANDKWWLNKNKKWTLVRIQTCLTSISQVQPILHLVNCVHCLWHMRIFFKYVFRSGTASPVKILSELEKTFWVNKIAKIEPCSFKRGEGGSGVLTKWGRPRFAVA